MIRKTMLTALLLAGLAGCRSATPEALVRKQCDENRSAIEKTIPDAERRTSMLGIIDDFEFQIRVIAEESKAARERYNTALRSRETTHEELTKLQAEMAACLERLCLAAQRHSLELRKHCSAAEWEQITAHYHKLKELDYLQGES